MKVSWTQKNKNITIPRGIQKSHMGEKWTMKKKINHGKGQPKTQITHDKEN
jgi:hypothetical protein